MFREGAAYVSIRAFKNLSPAFLYYTGWYDGYVTVCAVYWACKQEKPCASLIIKTDLKRREKNYKGDNDNERENNASGE